MTSAPLCVQCRKRPADERWRPFCSERCKLLDLAAWADANYRIAGEPVSAPQGPAEPPEDEER
jgi:endogenous inhibitor of DNA gyrase (YacG/DUF329 family)